MKTALVAMSGGIDSSVTVHLLKQQGYKVQGITFSFFDGFDTDSAVEVAQFLKVPHIVIDASDQFDEKVVQYAWKEYKNGRTSNPCAFCNRHMKFETLFSYAHKFDTDYIATGHYARTLRFGSMTFLQRGLDTTRDQSYFLFAVKKEHLHKVLFPLGEMTKDTVKSIGRSLKLPNKERKESRGVCFVGSKQTLPEVLEGKFGSTEPGKILDTNGKEVGVHEGIHRYTIGQRKGLGAFGGKIFVKSINSTNNTITIASDEELFVDRFHFDDLNLLTGYVRGRETKVQIRYGHPSVPILRVESDLVILQKKVRAITPGQATVFYNGDTVIGGGWIR